MMMEKVRYHEMLPHEIVARRKRFPVAFIPSGVLELHGERMVKRTFDPGFRIELHQKDLNLALSGARALGMSLPGTALAQELFNACAGNGFSGLDHSALVRALELMADHTVA